MAHELRNALVPAQLAVVDLKQQLRTVAGLIPPSLGFSGDPLDLAIRELPKVIPELEGIETAMTRSLDFAKGLVDLAPSGGVVLEPFRIVPALHEAIETSGVKGAELVIDHIPLELTLNGVRSRFVLAAVNLLRNAAQAGARASWSTMTAPGFRSPSAGVSSTRATAPAAKAEDSDLRS